MSDDAIACAVDNAVMTHDVNGATMQSPLYGLTQLDRFLRRSGGIDEGNSLSVSSDYVETNPEDTGDPGGKIQI